MGHANLFQSETSNSKAFLHEELTSKIIGFFYEVMNELGVGFSESVYHKAQVINYLAASKLPVGLIINFGQLKVQTARLQHPSCRYPGYSGNLD